jgi:hypothetical protein
MLSPNSRDTRQPPRGRLQCDILPPQTPERVAALAMVIGLLPILVLCYKEKIILNGDTYDP